MRARTQMTKAHMITGLARKNSLSYVKIYHFANILNTKNVTSNKGNADKCTWFPKLVVDFVREIRFEVVRYDHCTSFETLGHTFVTFFHPKL